MIDDLPRFSLIQAAAILSYADAYEKYQLFNWNNYPQILQEMNNLPAKLQEFLGIPALPESSGEEIIIEEPAETGKGKEKTEYMEQD